MPTITSFLSPLSRWFPITTQYGAPTAAGPHAGEPHYGLDFGATFGEPVYSMGTGRVVEPNDNPDRVTGGNTVTVDYGNGVKVLFAHLSQIYVRPGDTVAPGQRIGAVGNSGITTGGGGTAGSHLHLEAWRGSEHINPLDLFDFTRDIDASQYQTSGVMCRPAIPFVGMNKDLWKPLNADGGCDFGYIKVDSGNEFIDLTDTPVEGVGDALDSTAQAAAGVAEIAGALLDPANWARILAILGGAILTMIGAYMVWQST